MVWEIIKVKKDTKLKADKEYYITCVFTQDSGANFEIGTDGSNHLHGSIKFVKVKDVVITLAQHKADYNKYARQVVFNEDMVNQNADEVTYSANTHFENGVFINSGSFRVKEDSTSKYIECVTNGTISYDADLSDYIGNGYVKILQGDLSTDQGDTVDNASSLSFSGNKLTITMTANQKLRKLIITKNEEL